MREKMMNRIAEAVKEVIETECEVQFRKVEKNNGLVLQALIIQGHGASVCPVIYIDELLEGIGSGKIGVQDAAQEIVNIYMRHKDNRKFSGIVGNLSKQSILGKVMYQLINAGKNEGRLADMPHKRMLDLAAVYRIVAEANEMSMASIPVSNEICRAHSISAEELDIAAKRNTEKNGFLVQPMSSVIAEITGVPEEIVENECPAWVISTNNGIHGATVMLYESYFDNLANSIGSDLYILPCSIHEVIAVTAEGMALETLKTIVKEINICEVAEDEVLSGNVYRYSYEKCELTIAMEEKR